MLPYEANIVLLRKELLEMSAMRRSIDRDAREADTECRSICQLFRWENLKLNVMRIDLERAPPDIHLQGTSPYPQTSVPLVSHHSSRMTWFSAHKDASDLQPSSREEDS